MSRRFLAGKSVFLFLGAGVLALDQWSKWLVKTRLPQHQSVEIIPGCLNLTHVENTGVAFGMLAARGNPLGTWVLTLLGVIALGVVGIYFWRTPGRDKILLAALGLIMGGAIGNLIDRVAAGAVTDFIDFYVGTYHWHTFNVADSAITIGITLMAIDVLFGKKSQDPAAASTEANGAVES